MRSMGVTIDSIMAEYQPLQIVNGPCVRSKSYRGWFEVIDLHPNISFDRWRCGSGSGHLQEAKY